ncbi:hypothetical protein AUEXF2481DRAFT_44087 [Aureobasidium subglaciale EXF-2481]|uniref:Secreted protein n=1 Tax=Aureobasidium subglaciale (strain EXF-2481) TaxID=1043005 RepID=A0A074YXB6_AURSE|nr:uncharacterized protein AUEXF2481DRAFT_44087 [Aureobasidium subglaciale EXF-2481]KEQ91491.1 hypothetical protein AUEXF2481DRAFT_44087 [Aureobasidium subglaciale EXF-2481]
MPASVHLSHALLFLKTLLCRLASIILSRQYLVPSRSQLANVSAAVSSSLESVVHVENKIEPTHLVQFPTESVQKFWVALWPYTHEELDVPGLLSADLWHIMSL